MTTGASLGDGAEAGRATGQGRQVAGADQVADNIARGGPLPQGQAPGPAKDRDQWRGNRRKSRKTDLVRHGPQRRQRG